MSDNVVLLHSPVESPQSLHHHLGPRRDTTQTAASCPFWPEYITDAQRQTILDKIADRMAAARKIGLGTVDKAVFERTFCQYMKVPSVAELPASLYQRAIDVLNKPVKPSPISPPYKPPETWPEQLSECLRRSYDEPVRADELHSVALDLYEMIANLQAKVGVPQTAKARRGRPPKSFTARLAFFAGMWMDANATECVADLVRAMEAECDRRGWEIGDTQLRELAADFMEDFRALRRRD